MGAAQRGTYRLTEDRLDLLFFCSFNPVSGVLSSTAHQAEPLEGNRRSRRDRDHPGLKCCPTDHRSALPRHLTRDAADGYRSDAHRERHFNTPPQSKLALGSRS